MVVMVILVLMCSVVAISMRPALGDARLRSACRVVSSMLNYARSYAVTRQTYTRVEFDRAKNGLRVLAHVRDQNGEESLRPVTTQSGRFRLLPRGVVLSGVHTLGIEEERNLVGFSPLGQADETIITLQDGRGRQQVITVDSITGRAAVAEGKS